MGCRENEFSCARPSSGGILSRASCIPNSWVCDGHVDCDNQSDEPSTCPPKTCSRGYFKCNNTQCIPQSWTCGIFFKLKI